MTMHKTEQKIRSNIMLICFEYVYIALYLKVQSVGFSFFWKIYWQIFNMIYITTSS